ncbi:MAG: sigma 54-interacting transcriptional regulator [Kiritimatiellae bacterium]|nr:sigma 54-interacting transcriptional regulator [Kiritimatiellia bacterium]
MHARSKDMKGSDRERGSQHHPVAARFAESEEELLTILRRSDVSGEPAGQALVALQEFLSGKQTAEAALAAAQQAPIAEMDPELAILFFGSWAEVSGSLGRIVEATALLHRAEALLSEDTLAEVRSYLLTVEGFLASCEGNKVRREHILKEVLACLPLDSPRRQFHVLELAYLLARLGRALEIETDLDWLSARSATPFMRASVVLLRFINAVETGDTERAASLMPVLNEEATHLDAHSANTFREYEDLFGLIRDTRGSRIGNLPAPDSSVAPPQAAVTRCLLARRPDDALRWARLAAKESDRFVFRHGFFSFDLVRAELSAGHGEAARRVLDMRRARGNEHYLDDFFLARVELLAGHREVAAQHFGAALKAMEHYQAEGRLDFELRLACELAPRELVRLARAVEAASPAHAAPAPHPSETGGSQGPAATGTGRLEGRSATIAAVREAILRFAPLDVPVFVTGETGTGKELVARALHDASPRRDRPFIAINCGAISETLLESELFGHEKGAFSGAVKARRGVFEEAADGTLFLDEIGDISNHLQLALLRVLETGEIRPVGSSLTRRVVCRVVFATNADLEARASAGTFRKDLLFRLRRLEIHVAPLRDRAEDILTLARHFLDLGRPAGEHASLSPELAEALTRHDWPGNVRELRNVIERMRLINSDKLAYDLKDLDVNLRDAGGQPVPKRPMEDTVPPSRPTVRKAKSVPAKPPAAGRDDAAPRPAPAKGQGDVGALLRGGKSRLRRIERLRELFLHHKTLTRSEVTRVLGVSPNTATQDLKTLCDEGFVVRVEPSASSRSYYFALSNTVPPRPEPEATPDRKRSWFSLGKKGGR